MSIGTESSPYHVPAQHYAVDEGDREGLEKALKELRLLAAGRYSPYPGTSPVTMLECATSDAYGSISHRTSRADVQVVVATDGGRHVGWRFARGNGDPVRHVGPAMDDDSGLLLFASAMIMHLEHALDADPGFDRNTVLLPAIGRAMRRHRHQDITDWRDIVHSQSATPWSRPRVFNEIVDIHGNNMPGPNLLSAKDRKRPSQTALRVLILETQAQSQVTVEPMEASLDPEVVSVIEEMRAYVALDAEPTLV